MRFSLGIAVIFASLAVAPGPASAHPMLDRGVQAYEEADFDRALHTFDTAVRNADLSVEELQEVTGWIRGTTANHGPLCSSDR